MRFLIFTLVIPFWTFTLKAESLHVYAAASLTEVMQRVAAAYNPKEKILFNFDASSKLAHQINSGAPADLFFSADSDWMEFLQKNERIISRTRRDLLNNRIVLVVPKNKKNIATKVQDLLDKSFARIALAGEAVPAGKFARRALKHEGLDPEKIKHKTVTADNVKVALKWVSLGEAQAGIVYQTDAIVDPNVKIAFIFPETSHPKIIYPAGVVAQTKNLSAAQKFLDFCQSDKAKEIFSNAGFTTL